MKNIIKERIHDINKDSSENERKNGYKDEEILDTTFYKKHENVKREIWSYILR